MISHKVQKYMGEISKSLKQIDQVVAMIGRENQHLVDDLYNSALLRMCIKYEAFTSEAFRKLFHKNTISYNRPWDYTRKIAKKLRVDISQEYRIAHDGWDIYNSLKHVNVETMRWSAQTEKRLGLKTARDRAVYIHDALLNLLQKFY